MEAAMEVFDPTCLLTVVEALQGLTKGLTFDPASGEIGVGRAFSPTCSGERFA